MWTKPMDSFLQTRRLFFLSQSEYFLLGVRELLEGASPLSFLQGSSWVINEIMNVRRIPWGKASHKHGVKRLADSVPSAERCG